MSGRVAIGWSRGELIMSHQQFLTPVQEQAAVVRSCWMCGIHLPAEYMVADGGSACADVRWYCLDTRACTGRWTSRPAGPADFHPGAAGSLTSHADESAFAGRMK